MRSIGIVENIFLLLLRSSSGRLAGGTPTLSTGWFRGGDSSFSFFKQRSLEREEHPRRELSFFRGRRAPTKFWVVEMRFGNF